MKISVVIPTYNAVSTLPRLIDAVHEQLSDSYEIVVIDDGSTDNTRDVLADMNVRYHYQENAGPAVARNYGSQLAQGEILVFLDSDLVPDKGFFDYITKPFDDDSIAAVQGVTRTAQKELLAQYCQHEIDYKQLRCRKQRFIDSIAAGTFAIRKSVFEKFGGYHTDFRMAAAEDTDLSFRMAKDNQKILFCPEASASHPHPFKLKGYIRLKFWRGYWRALLYKRHPDKMVNDSYTSHLQKFQVVACLLFPLWLASVLYFHNTVYLILTLLLFATSCVPAMFYIFRKSTWQIALLTPIMQVVASASLALGLLIGSVREVLTTTKSPVEKA